MSLADFLRPPPDEYQYHTYVPTDTLGLVEVSKTGVILSEDQLRKLRSHYWGVKVPFEAVPQADGTFMVSMRK